MTSTTSPAVGTIVSAAEAKGARVGLSAILPDGSSINHRENEVFKSASTIKIAIMIELFRRIEAGDLLLDQRYVLKQEDKVPGNGVLQELHAGIELTLRDVLYLMMSISDNPATKILIDHVSMDAVNATMRELGLQESVLGRPMRGRPANPDEQENLATPAEFARLIAAIMDGTAASAESCMAMLEMLKLQANDKRIGRFVPADMEWGSKTGSYDTVVNDVGFVMTKDGPLIISIFSEDVADVVTGEAIISEIVRELLMSSLDS
jgi:beta-lactamase class A